MSNINSTSTPQTDGVFASLMKNPALAKYINSMPQGELAALIDKASGMSDLQLFEFISSNSAALGISTTSTEPLVATLKAIETTPSVPITTPPPTTTPPPPTLNPTETTPSVSRATKTTSGEVSKFTESDGVTYFSGSQASNHLSERFEGLLIAADKNKDGVISSEELDGLGGKLQYTSENFVATLREKLGNGSVDLAKTDKIKSDIQSNLNAGLTGWKTPEQVDSAIARAFSDSVITVQGEAAPKPTQIALNPAAAETSRGG